jgi:nitric oxide reductase NorD protein
MERYRVLAIERAARLVRGTGAEPLPSDALERDLYLLAESASIDRDIVAQAPGLGRALEASRRAELAARLPLNRVRAAEREVEALLQALLAATPDTIGTPLVPSTRTPEESRAWARDEADRLRARAPLSAAYAGVRPITLWAIDPAAHAAAATSKAGMLPLPGNSPNATGKRVAPRSNPADVQRPPDAQGAASAEGSETLTAARASAGTESGSETEATQGARATAQRQAYETTPPPGSIPYPEWDEYANRYRPDEVSVRAGVARETDARWAIDTLRTHAPLVRQIRARFAPLRAHRTRLRAQRSGDELDLDACVGALVDMRRGQLPGDRLYLHTRPARHTLAIMLLVDVSGSTNAQLADGRSVLDVERMTLLLASEALDELGDPYAVLAFSSSGRHDVQVDAVKAFADHDPDLVRRRVSALASARNTRLGAALRHATALLNAQRAERRLLLLLSDGQPNDIGGYQGSYAVGDSRRAVLEARASGVHTFCLTVDREEQEYLPLLFGTNGYRILREPAQLPAALLQVVTQLLPQ